MADSVVSKPGLRYMVWSLKKGSPSDSEGTAKSQWVTWKDLYEDNGHCALPPLHHLHPQRPIHKSTEHNDQVTVRPAGHFRHRIKEGGPNRPSELSSNLPPPHNMYTAKQNRTQRASRSKWQRFWLVYRNCRLESKLRYIALFLCPSGQYLTVDHILFQYSFSSQHSKLYT
jgi:hypothetical protein